MNSFLMRMALGALCALCALSVCGQTAGPAPEDARAIMRRSVQADNRNEAIRTQYTYKVFNVEHDLNDAGKVTATHSSLAEVLYIGRQGFRQLLEKDGKPLPADEAAKARARFDKAVKEASNLNPQERKARADRAAASRTKRREQLQYIPDAFDFRLLGETVIDGRAAWQIQASPRRDYKGPQANVYRNMEGTLWIDKKDYQWVKVEADALDTVSFGWFLARIAKGTAVQFENVRVNDEMWAPKHVTLRASVRLALVKKLHSEQETTYSDYRKFQTDSRMVATEAEPAQP